MIKKSSPKKVSKSPADMILINGRIATMDEHSMFVSAVAIKGGCFIDVGTDNEIMAHRSDKTLVIDAGGRMVIPGLNDSHIHIIRGGLNYNMELRWDGVTSLAEALQMVREQAKRTPPPHWVNAPAWEAITPELVPHSDGKQIKRR